MKNSPITKCLKNKQKKYLRSTLNLSAIIVIALTLPGCLAHNPPHHHSHAAANVQVLITYDYYPNLHIYYNRHQQLYYYQDKHRSWLTVRVLPSYIRLQGQRRHIIKSKNSRPWQQNHRYKRPQSYIETHSRSRKDKHKNSRW